MTEQETFRGLGVADELVSVLDARGIDAPFPIQSQTIPPALLRRDVCGKAKTGSGKTLAFGLPILQLLDTGQSGVRALVLVPTRELALQVHEELEPLGAARSISLLAVYGGAPIEKQIARIEKGVDMIVATPGRLIDLIDRKVVSVSGLQHVVVDEADRMADKGFLPQVEWILRHVEGSHQTLLFSATLDGVVDTLIKRYQTDPSMHEVDSGQVSIEHMQHRFLAVHQMDKVKVAARIANTSDKTMMFTATKHGADRLAKALNDEGVEAAAIHGDLRQNLRERALRQFGDGELSVLVATDVAARGIHVDDVGTVIHYDPPQDHKAYLHRSGRTARAGANGLAVTLSLWDQELVIRQLQRRLGLEADIIEVFSNDERLGNLSELIPETA